MQKNQTAKDILRSVVKSFHESEKLAEKVKNADKKVLNDDSEDNEETDLDKGIFHANCVICHKKIGKFELVTPLPCCSAPCHIKCIADANCKGCPNCKVPVPNSLTSLAKSLLPLTDLS